MIPGDSPATPTEPRTWAEWLTALGAVVDRGWHVQHDGSIRDTDARCPLCALAHEVSGGRVDLIVNWQEAMRRLFWRRGPAAAAIARAADLPHSPFRPVLESALGVQKADQ